MRRTSFRFPLYGLSLAVGLLFLGDGCSAEPDQLSLSEAAESAGVVATEVDAPGTGSDSELSASRDSATAISDRMAEESSASDSARTTDRPIPRRDTTGVECPVGRKRGDATIRIDSTGEDLAVDVEPDSHLTEELEKRWGSHWDYFGGKKARVNGDEHPDLIVDVGTTILSKNVKTYTDIFVGCGGDRYAVVGERLLFDHFGTWDDGEEKWKTVYTKHELGPRNPPLTYTKRYRFYRGREEYRIVPGSVWYTERSAERLGFDYEDRPSCPAGGKHPPVKLKAASSGKSLSESGRVQRRPFKRDDLYIYWIGNLNNDLKDDLILERREKDYRTAKTVYASCDKSFYSNMYFDISRSIEVLGEYDRGREYEWRKILEMESKGGIIDTILFKWDDYRK